MTPLVGFAGLIAILLFIYLFAAMFRPELFE